jgi:hypothetical protein
MTVSDPSLKAVNISTEAALGHFRSDFEIHDMHLDDYLIQTNSAHDLPRALGDRSNSDMHKSRV